MNDFIYDIPVTVYFGKDQLKNLTTELKKYGKNVLMTYGGGSIKKSGLYDKVINEIKKADLDPTTMVVVTNSDKFLEVIPTKQKTVNQISQWRKIPRR